MRATGSIQNIMETTLETIKGSIDANTTVSYTHLDVYKRQECVI